MDVGHTMSTKPLSQYKGKTRRQYMHEWHGKYREYWASHDPHQEIKTKRCTHCRKTQPSQNFHKSVTDKDGLQAWCLHCCAGRGAARQMLVNARARARRYGLEFSITLQDIKVPEFCPVFGFPLVVGSSGGFQTDASPSIDRIESSRGYTPDNVQVISWKANQIKGRATVEELEKVLYYMKSRAKCVSNS